MKAEALLRAMGEVSLDTPWKALRDLRYAWWALKSTMGDAEQAAIFARPEFRNYRAETNRRHRRGRKFRQANAAASRARYASKKSEPAFLTSQAERKRAAYWAKKGVGPDNVPPKRRYERSST